MAKRVLILPGALTIGGAEKMARDIAVYAEPGKWEFHYLVLGDRVGEYEPQLESLGCKICHVPLPGANYLRYLTGLLRLMKREGYSAVHAHTMFSCGWAMLAAKISGVPIRIAHAHSALKNGVSWKKGCYEFIMRRLILWCATDLAACSSPAGRRLFGGKAWENRGILLPNGIRREDFTFDMEKRRDIRARYGLEDCFVIGHAGHLTGVKNQRFLLELLPELRKIRPNAHLLLLGEGEDRPALEKIVRELGLENAVTMTGNVTDMGAHYSAMDVFALPSLYEGAPLVLLEARANGLPCVVSRGVEETGLPLEQAAWVAAVLAAKRGVAAPVTDIREGMERVYERYEQDQGAVSHRHPHRRRCGKGAAQSGEPSGPRSV